MHTGIVLRQQFPLTHKVTILDRALGVIEGFVHSTEDIQRLCHSAYATYQVRRYKNRYFITDVSTQHVPFAWARHDILFLHHVLEMTYAFMPQALSQATVFDLIASLYETQACDDRSTKTFFLARLFLAFGTYPEDETTFSWLQRITTAPVDGAHHSPLHLEAESRLNAWLVRCAQLHPQYNDLKTIHFLTESGRHGTS